MAEGVNIPVSVSGADAAAEDLRTVGKSVEGVGQASAAQAGGATAAGAAAAVQAEKLEEVGKQAGRAGGHTDDLNRKGEQLVKGVLREVNPELANMADLMIDAFEGAGKLSANLLLLGAAGAALGVAKLAFDGISDAIRKADEEAKRFEEARRKARDETIAQGADVAGEAIKLGIDPGRAGAILADTRAIGLGGVPLDMARRAALARQLAEGAGIGFNLDQFLGGQIAAGGAVEFGGDQAANADTIRRTMEAGADAEMQRRLANLRSGAGGEAARREAVELSAAGVDPDAQRKGLVDAAIERARAQGILRREGDVEQVRWVLRGVQAARERGDDPPISSHFGSDDPGTRVAAMIQAALDELPERGGAAGGPVTVNIINHNNTHNVANQWQHGADPRDDMSQMGGLEIMVQQIPAMGVP